jgi:hypothetical protein
MARNVPRISVKSWLFNLAAAALPVLTYVAAASLFAAGHDDAGKTCRGVASSGPDAAPPDDCPPQSDEPRSQFPPGDDPAHPGCLKPETTDSVYRASRLARASRPLSHGPDDALPAARAASGHRRAPEQPAGHVPTSVAKRLAVLASAIQVHAPPRTQ